MLQHYKICHSPHENSTMRSSPTPAEKSSSLLKSATFAEHLSELLNMGRKTLFIMSSFIVTYGLHGSSCNDDCSALLQDLGKVDRWVQQQELNAALRQRSCILKQTWHFFNQRSFKTVNFDFCHKDSTLVVHHHSPICVAVGESHKETLHLHHGRCGRHLLRLYWPLLVSG